MNTTIGIGGKLTAVLFAGTLLTSLVPSDAKAGCIFCKRSTSSTSALNQTQTIQLTTSTRGHEVNTNSVLNEQIRLGNVGSGNSVGNGPVVKVNGSNNAAINNIQENKVGFVGNTITGAVQVVTPTASGSVKSKINPFNDSTGTNHPANQTQSEGGDTVKIF